MKKIVLTFLLFLIPSLGHAATTWYACSGGGNWNGASVWTSVQVDQVGCTASTGNPVAGDTAILNSSSGNITVSATAAAAVVTMTGYTGTFAMGSQTLTVTGGVTLCDTSCTLTGTPATGVLSLTGSQTIIGNGKTWPVRVSVSGTETITLNGNWVQTGVFSNAGVVTLTPTASETLTTNGGYTANGGLSGNVKLILGGTGGIWTDASTTVVNMDINCTSLTISGTVGYSTGTLTYVAGAITTTGSTLNILGSSTLNVSGMLFNNVFFETGGTETLLSNLNLSGSISIGVSDTVTTSGAFNINAGTLTSTSSSGGTEILIMPAGQSLNISTAINITNTNFTLKSATVSSPIFLNYTGPVSEENMAGATFTDVKAVGPAIPFYGSALLDYNGCTTTVRCTTNLTRTTGIVNVGPSNIFHRPINPNTGV